MIHEVKFIDLKKSIINVKKSDPKVDKYVFFKKVYIKADDYKTSGSRPDHILKWNRQSPSGLEISQWKSQGYTFVTPNDPYWPEGVNRNSEGHYQYGDTVLMKCDIIAYAKRQLHKIKMSDRARYNKMAGFENEMKKDGVAIDHPMLDEIFEG